MLIPISRTVRVLLPLGMMGVGASAVLPLAAAPLIRYEDANELNVRFADDRPVLAATAEREFTDARWSYRRGEGMGNGGTIFEAGGGEQVPELIQIASGLEPGLYDFYLYFWVILGESTDGKAWQCAGGLAPDKRVIHKGAKRKDGTVLVHPFGAMNASVAELAAPRPLFVEGGGPEQTTGQPDRTLVSVYLGRKKVGEDGKAEVYIGNGPLLDNPTDSRTWFDGIGYCRVEGQAGLVGRAWGVGGDNGKLVLDGYSEVGAVWGDGTPLNAADTAIHATLDVDAATEAIQPINLVKGDGIALRGEVTIHAKTALSGSPLQFRWGLFDHNDSAPGGAWTGIWTGNGGGGSPGGIYRKSSGGKLYIGLDGSSEAGIQYSRHVPVLAEESLGFGPMAFELTIHRGETEVYLRSTLQDLTTKKFLCDTEATMAAPADGLRFTRAGFLAGKFLKADRLILRNVEVVYPLRRAK